MCIDIKNFVTPLTRYDYLRIYITLITDDIFQQYNLLPLVRNGFIYLEIIKGMYRLPRAGRLAKYVPTGRLMTKRHFQSTHTPVLWRQKWHPVLLLLVVDAFVIKYVVKEHTNHLITAISEL